MKNLFKTMMLVAVAAMGFTACSNEAFEEVNPAIEKGFSLTISAEKPALESDTRTEFVDGSVIWTKGDKVRMSYLQGETWSNYYASNEAESEDDFKTATFTFNNSLKVDESLTGAYTFYAGYPNDKLNGDKTYAPVDDAVSVEVLTEQVMPKADTFDAKADIMVGVSEEYAEWPEEEVVALQFHRLVAHGCVTLKGLKAENGELIKTVKFTAPENVKLTGEGSVNFVEQTMTALSDNTVTVAMPANTAANANVDVWFCSAPATIASGENLTVEVETTRGTYTRTITANPNGIKFLQNRYNTLGINMADAVFEAAAVSETVYKQITSMAELTSGEYVIAGLYNSSYYPMLAKFTSGKITAKSTIIVNNGQITEADAEGYVVTLAVSTDGISISDGTYYLDWKSSTDFKTSSTTAAYWTATYVSDMFKIIDNDTDRAILWQYNSGNSRFAPYATSNFTANGYSGLYLFKKTTGEGGGETPEPTPVLATPTSLNANAVEKDVTITWDKVANATSYYVTCGGQTNTVNVCEAHFTMDAYSTKYNISVVAKADGYTDSVAATTTVTTETDPNAGGDEPEEVTFELTATATFANNQLTWSQNGITIVQDKGNGSTAVNSGYNKVSTMRVYQGHTLTFSSEYNITKVEIVTQNNKYFGPTATASVGTLTNPKTNGCTITWEGSSKNLVITNGKGSGGEQIRATKIVITYTK